MGVVQSFKPKHQVLVMRCYPKYQKSTTDVKPNSSELSYLLYYVSTRRSKLQKVGAFLEKRTTSDVRKARLGNVQVTLQILTALIEKCPRDLPLYSSYVLNMLSTVVHSSDINFVEESVAPFTAFSSHLDHAIFASDPMQSRQYDDIISVYAAFACGQQIPQTYRSRMPESLRFRTAGLKAMRSLVSAESLSGNPAHISILIPCILQQLISADTGYFTRLEQGEDAKEQAEKEMLQRHRPSLSASKSVDLTRSPMLVGNTGVATGTAEDADKRTREALSVAAFQALKELFSADNRGQIRTATTMAMDFSLGRDLSTSWVIELFMHIAQWTPVQDRFIPLIVLVERLSSYSEGQASDANRARNILGLILLSLLDSEISFIGLSVIDVLIGFILAMDSAPEATSDLMERCIAALARHKYYSSQIPHMISTLFDRCSSQAQAVSCSKQVTAASNTRIEDVQGSLSPHILEALGYATGKSGPRSATSTGRAGVASRSAMKEALNGSSSWASGAQATTVSSHSSDNAAIPVVGVDDLKRALSGIYTTSRPISSMDTATNSLVSGDFSASERSLPGRGRSTSLERPIGEADPLHRDTPPVDRNVPPVPALPNTVRQS